MPRPILCSNNPHQDLAIAVLLQAVSDTKQEDTEAEQWLRHSPWCQTLLDYANINISGSEIVDMIIYEFGQSFGRLIR